MDETNNPEAKDKAQALPPFDTKDGRDSKCTNGRLFCLPYSSSSSSASSRSRSTSPPPPPPSRPTSTPEGEKKKAHLSTSKGKSDKSRSTEIEEAVEKWKRKVGKHTKHSEHNKHGKRSSSKKKHRPHRIKDGTHAKEDENHEEKKAKSKDKISSKKKSRHHRHHHHHHHRKHNPKKMTKHSKSSRSSKRTSSKHRHSRKHHRHHHHHHHRSKSSSCSTSSSSSMTSPSVSLSGSSTSSYSSFSSSPSISSSSSSSYSSPSSSRSLSPIVIRHESRRSRSSRRTLTKPGQSEKDARVLTKEKVLREKKERDLEREILNRQRDRSKSPDACIDGSKELFVGNIDSFVKRSDIEEAFGKYGEVTRIDLRRGFCFVWLKGDARGAKDAFNGTPFGTSKRILRVRWSEKGKDKVFRNNVDPCETLFIANFDPFTTSKEVEDLFSKYGHVVRVSLKRNFGFVQYSDVGEAIDAVRNLDGYRVKKCFFM